jgi:hypothetical protein
MPTVQQRGTVVSIEQKHTSGTFRRIVARIRCQDLAEILAKSGMIAEGFRVESAHFDDYSMLSMLEISLVSEVIENDNEIYEGRTAGAVELPQPR